MTCPLYKDYTRGCIVEFPKLLSSVTYDFCDSDGYKICPFYKIIVEKKPSCEFVEECGSQFIKNAKYLFENPGSYGEIRNLIEEYCLSDININCARYKLYKAGKKAPMLLLADGSKIKLRDVLF